MGAPGASASAAPPTGQSVVAARNAKKAALDEFARDNNLKPESIKKAYKRFQATDKDKSGMIDYTEFCEVLQCDPSPQGERLFQLFDYEKSGQIDVREFMIALSNFTGVLRCINQIVASMAWRCGLLRFDSADPTHWLISHRRGQGRQAQVRLHDLRRRWEWCDYEGRADEDSAGEPHGQLRRRGRQKSGHDHAAGR